MVVLLVEDDPIIAMAVAGELEAAGHRVLGPACDVRSARKLAQRGRPDFALIDIDLGEGGDSIDLARDLSRNGVLPVFASAECAQARANCDTAVAWLSKPYAPEAAVRSLEALVVLLKGQRAAMPPELEWFGRPPRRNESRH